MSALSTLEICAREHVTAVLSHHTFKQSPLNFDPGKTFLQQNGAVPICAAQIHHKSLRYTVTTCYNSDRAKVEGDWWTEFLAQWPCPQLGPKSKKMSPSPRRWCHSQMSNQQWQGMYSMYSTCSKHFKTMLDVLILKHFPRKSNQQTLRGLLHSGHLGSQHGSTKRFVKFTSHSCTPKYTCHDKLGFNRWTRDHETW